MLIFGNRSHTIELGTVEVAHCTICNQERIFKLYLNYLRFHVWYIFSLIEKRKYVIACEICKHGHDVDRRVAEQRLGTVPIPFMHRFGCLTLVVGILVVYLFTQLIK